MSREAIWPPRPTRHKATGQDRVRWQGHDYYLGRSGSAEARAAYVDLIGRLEQERQDAPKADRPTVKQIVALWRIHAINHYGPDNPEERTTRRSLEFPLPGARGELVGELPV